MILWGDFVLHKNYGPILWVDSEFSPEQFKKVCGEEESGSNIKEDISGLKIQETGQGQQPARMVGTSSSDLRSPIGMEADLALDFDSLPQTGGVG